CWVAIGAASASLGRGAVTGTLEAPGSHILEILAYGLMTACAFGLTFAALQRIGAGRTAVVMTLEAFSAVVLAAVGAAALIARGRDVQAVRPRWRAPRIPGIAATN
ncbi:MAG: hypothetical protein QOF76_2494, partial [Solirubrobacteraceae bacterium]|nr:hypothetical protein [Solirubrobacteraceae bacterium]